MKILHIVGARPNFMKIAPLYREFQLYNSMNSTNPINSIIVHTGQHYDFKMSQVLVKQQRGL